MPTCQNCSSEWNWRQTFKKIFTLDTAIECPYCGKKQYFTKQSKKRMAALTFLIPISLLINLFDIPPYFFGGFYLVLSTSVMVISPFLIELSNEEEFR